jgi:peptidoglycan/LPS O-acetylase OafA/YrhL
VLSARAGTTAGMCVRNHALDGLRGLAALGVLTMHVWMFTVQHAHGLYPWHLPVLLWLRFEGLLPRTGFVGPWIEVAALSVLMAVASWVLVERPVIQAAGRWRPWSRRVPTFPAELHIKPLPSAA